MRISRHMPGPDSRTLLCRGSWQTLVALLFCLAGGAAQAAELASVRLWAGSTASRMVLDLNGAAVHNVFSLRKPDRLVIDLAGTSMAADTSKLDFRGTPVLRLRSGKRDNGDLRLVLELDRAVSARSFSLQPEGEYGHRLVMDLPRQITAGKPAALDTRKAAAIMEIDPTEKRDIVVVIDPGHGGKDPGAVGASRLREKDVVLKIARELMATLNKRPGYSAVLTRTDDRFLQLRQRTAIARRANADLLVSIHADAFRDPRAFGASVYALSRLGASSEAARWLAAKENASDLIGGTGGVSLTDKDEVLAEVLLDLSMTASMRASMYAGRSILSSMKLTTDLHKQQVESAGFVVLKNPDIPSILVETGFISNPSESRRLNEPTHQRGLATAIAKGIHEYFWESPPPGSLLAYQKNPAAFMQAELAMKADEGHESAARTARGVDVSATRTVQRGDTLSGMALEANTSIREIMRLNGLSSSRLRIGQVIRMPSS